MKRTSSSQFEDELCVSKKIHRINVIVLETLPNIILQRVVDDFLNDKDISCVLQCSSKLKDIIQQRSHFQKRVHIFHKIRCIEFVTPSVHTLGASIQFLQKELYVFRTDQSCVIEKVYLFELTLTHQRKKEVSVTFCNNYKGKGWWHFDDDEKNKIYHAWTWCAIANYLLRWHPLIAFEEWCVQMKFRPFVVCDFLKFKRLFAHNVSLNQKCFSFPEPNVIVCTLQSECWCTHKFFLP